MECANLEDCVSVGPNGQIYRGKLIEKLFPSGYYEVYSDTECRFLRFDDFDDAKARIDAECYEAGK